MTSFCFPCFFLVIVTLFLSVSSQNTIHDKFLACFSAKTNRQDNIATSSIVITQSNSSYTSVLRAYIRNARFNTSRTQKPEIIVTPTLESHVQATVVCAKSLNIQVKIRSGGHDYDGLSYISDHPFIILDMFNFKKVDVNIQEETAYVEAGATLGELFYRISEKSKVHGFPAGVCPTVGVGGHLSGGGYGNMLRKYGLSVDHIVDAKMVDVKGRVLDRMSMGEDLFWAIRGGGGASFGVVLSYKVKLVRVPETVTVFRLERLLAENATDMVYKWQEVAPNTDNDLFMRMLIQPVTSNKSRTIRATIITEFLGSSDRLVSILAKEYPELGLKKENCIEMSWIQSVLWWANFDNGTAPEALLDRNLDNAKFLKRKSDYVQKPISKDGLEWLWKKMIEIGKTGLVFNPYGGKMSEIPATDTPFPHRAGNLFKIQHSVSWNEPGPEAEKEHMTDIRRLYSYMTGFVSRNPRSAFLNYRDIDIGVAKNWTLEEGKVYGVKYFGENYDRLVKVKTAVDPDNFFRNEQSIPPLSRAQTNASSIGWSASNTIAPPGIWMLGIGWILVSLFIFLDKQLRRMFCRLPCR